MVSRCPGGAVGVGVAAPDVDDELAVDGHRRGRADLQALSEVGLERVAHLLEAGLAGSMDLHAPMMARCACRGYGGVARCRATMCVVAGTATRRSCPAACSPSTAA